MSAHTPGPWTVEDGHYSRYVVMSADRGTIVAEIIDSEDDPHAWSDAYLIAAAPELLGLAMTADHTLGTIMEYLALDSGDEARELAEQILWLTDLLRPVIAKAEGRSA